jgi:hypothetical protein
VVEQTSGIEYKILKFDTHTKAEKGLNEAVAEGWRLVTYRTPGDSGVITHFILLERLSAPSFPVSDR